MTSVQASLFEQIVFEISYEQTSGCMLLAAFNADENTKMFNCNLEVSAEFCSKT